MMNILINISRLLLGRLGSLFIMPSAWLLSDNAPRFCLVKARRFLSFLVGAGFLSVALIACAGGGGGSSSGPGDNGSEGNGSMVDGSGENGGGDGPGVFNVSLTFAPISGGFRIGNQSAFGDFVSLNIMATSRSESEERSVSITEFADDDSYDFTGLDDQSDWIFNITGTLSDGGKREVVIDFVWQENEDDHGSDGIRSGVDTDGDRRADSVDPDDDNDEVLDGEDIDADGDGLIELATAAALDAVRYALNGNGSRSSSNGELNTTGCGRNVGDACSGYELVTNISLMAYSGGSGWQPLGSCNNSSFSGTFEGNGWTISDLNISRSGENCVGLFGYVAEGSEIRNLRLRAEAVIGENSVGGLVGYGGGAQIVSSSVVVGNLSGHVKVGGLVGSGVAAWVNSSSVVASKVSGHIEVGGLVGLGESAQIVYSSVVVGELSGSHNNLGGLVGLGNSARIHSSSVVAGEMRGNRNNVGGLVGKSVWGRIHSSSAVVGKVSGSTRVGGLAGDFGVGVVGSYAGIISSFVVAGSVSGNKEVGGISGLNNSTLGFSYAVTGPVSGNSDSGGIIGKGESNKDSPEVEVHSSYWDSSTSDISSGTYGMPQTSTGLQEPTGYKGIYAAWDDGLNITGDSEVEDITIYCDRDNSGDIEAEERTSDNLIWDFGESDEYPSIRCIPTAPDDWRSWWYLNGTGKPQLNQTRLDERLPTLD